MAREKFATQVDSHILKDMRALAEGEGRHLQTLVDEAFADYIERRHQQRARPHVMAAYEASHDRYASVYKKLAE
jgi:predicted transcriptional regulator